MQSQTLATLIANPSRPALTDDVTALVRQVLDVSESAVRILDPGIAIEIAAHGPEHEIELKLRKALSHEPVDVFVRRGARVEAKLFLADMDSTMIEQECIDELADFVGLKAEVAAITARAMRGEIAFEPALRERVALLRGLDVNVVDEIVRDRLTLMPGGEVLLKTLKANGAYTCLVSSGFTLFTARIADLLGFDENHANVLLIEDGKFTGEVVEPILGREAKLATLKNLRAAKDIPAEAVMAVGDGANDLAMLGEAGLGVALHAKPAVAAAAHARIDHGDLTALLYLQGTTRDAFA